MARREHFSSKTRRPRSCSNTMPPTPPHPFTRLQRSPILSSPISPDLPAPTFSSSTPSSQSNHKSLIIAPGRISPLAFKYTPVLLKDFGITESVWNDQLLAPLRAATALQRSQKAFVAAAGVGLAVVTHGPIVPAIVGYVVWRKETLKNLHNGLLGQTSQGDMEKEGMGKKGEKKEPQTVADVLASFNAQLVPGGVHVSLLLPEQKGRKKKGCCTVQGTCNGMDNTESREGSKYCKCYRKGGWGCKSTRGRGCRGRMESCKERRERKSVRILIEGVGGDRSSVEKEQGEV